MAAIAVVLLHLGIDSARGGYVWGDVFFVISGFLIGEIVVREAEACRFRLADYFVRGVRRIVPVMVAMLAAVSLAAAILLLPSELAGYGTSLWFSALFAANIHFWLTFRERYCHWRRRFQPMRPQPPPNSRYRTTPYWLGPWLRAPCIP